MKITVITGSQHKGGNTFAMVDAFIKAAEAKGYEVKTDGCAQAAALAEKF